uniref:Uncharacterized protein n=1 Tax=Candidatus Methanogaster sp. ANME-2c ERB4 TaxID=2759911 RepID=A0A7G9Y692_9EURY|nr:hypothetical protein HEBJAHIM_00006 [Methanosarcinales archaeon ANME-2c ERB4]QNO42119.1 hypothetical protein INBEEEIC_00021 [Methanosarcinales archaeon ANME-2c ERB4]QNO42277.1 hypothetical protein CCKMDOMK_00006 [Methanosarcinales archaeon ANME-2c ERB4]QNO42485.1 hypothetical protein LBOOMNCC_00038 [Methanosarcinales archaeon ANME-2c ERB4]QNO42570.1 hypothetical protein MMDHCPHC_00006 [Methanosarcinales archaeon ANME-2c ERB4]
MATNRNRFKNMNELEMISSMTDSELSRNARRGGIDSILEIGYRLHGAAAANVQTAADRIMASPELDIGV